MESTGCFFQHFFVKLAIFFLVVLTKFAVSDSEFEGLFHVAVDHSFDQGPEPQWFKRGVITIRSVSNNLAQVVHSGPLSDRDAELLKQVALSGGIYRIRVPTQLDGTATVDSSSPTQYVTAYIKACALYESWLTDLIVLNADGNGLNLLGVSLTTSTPYTCAGHVLPQRVNTWNSSVEIRQTVPGPMPDTLSYVQKMEKEKADKAQGAQADNRSFIAKYWMYIVPVFLLMMIASSADQGQGGGR